MAEQAELAKTAAQPKPRTDVNSARAMMENFRARMTAMPRVRRNWLLVWGIFLLAAISTMFWYAQRPDWRPLFTGMEGKDVQQVAQDLAAAGIEYRVSADGASVEVGAGDIDKARMEVAAKGMPQSGRLGFELFDKPNWVGSEFDERVNYQRALEGELEHTITTLGVVRSARVHLVLPQQSLFTAEDKVAKASVVLKLKRSTVDPAEADSIRGLVAGAVDGLSPNDVVLVDADGRVDLKPHSKVASEGDTEQALEAKLVSLLEPLAGRDNVRATVRVAYDQGTEERSDEIYDPTQSAPLSMQRSEQSSVAAAKPAGVPGTASNTPAGAPAGAVQGSAAAAAPGTPPLLKQDPKEGLPVYPQQGGQNQTVKQESGSYAVTKHTIHTEVGPGRLGRLTAAIVVNDRLTTEGTGKSAHAVWKPRSPDEMHRLEELAQAAVGFDMKRGDQVVVQNMSFNSNTPEPLPPVMDRVLEQTKGFLHSQPNLMRTFVLGVCGVLLVLFVLRPVARQVTSTLREPLLLAAGSGSVNALKSAGGEGTEALGEGSNPEDASLPQRKGKNTAQMMFDSVSTQIKLNPSASRRLVESWIATPGPEE